MLEYLLSMHEAGFDPWLWKKKKGEKKKKKKEEEEEEEEEKIKGGKGREGKRKEKVAHAWDPRYGRRITSLRAAE